MKALALGTALLMLIAAAPATADAPCETSDDAIDTGLGLYVHVDLDQGGVWVYEESNGEPGLQRAAEDNGNCADGGADTIII